MNVARFVFGFFPSRPAQVLAPVVLGASVLTLLLVHVPAAPAADTDLTAGALAARKAVGLPAIEASAAVRAAATAVLDGGDPQGAFASNGGSGRLVTAT